CQQYNTWISF
nr:immunoglobulin light chain junction region [Macaca mulatta]MOX52173.1 immunoglobulin light chain junction region [Macaca mulatta]MOX52453.1 immunoglobulin light chain junction region [Macaca mulatta]MOX53504.1 immunoglobulin light chain junction region [Macaca mulatta]MOX54094.1 immunoglobulin light chain junction region [Macaca mulatta]